MRSFAYKVHLFWKTPHATRSESSLASCFRRLCAIAVLHSEPSDFMGKAVLEVQLR